jgi:hypothetical protein
MKPEGYIKVGRGVNPLEYLNDGYVLMDYKYVLEGEPFFAYHRDVMSSKTVFNTEYPTYTFLTYNYDGNLLSVCPGSHMMWMCDFPTTLRGNNGDGILFDCDLVHGGVRGPPGVEIIATEYKIVHLNDLTKLEHLDGVDMCKKGIYNPWLRKFLLRIFSYLFVVPIQWVFYKTRFLKSI